MHLKNIQPNTIRMKRLIEGIKKQGIADDKVLAVLATIPRELFVSKALATDAYDDACLPIGELQTISMPSVVARMTSALELTGTEKVLEIGTGCGYQTVILSRLCRRVYTVERHKSLSEHAVKRLHDMGITNFTPLVGDGTLGWPAQAPFERIIVTAAGPWVPAPLVEQLAIGGILVIPVGPQETAQKLLKIRKLSATETSEENLGPVAFVPLVGQQGAAQTFRA